MKAVTVSLRRDFHIPTIAAVNERSADTLPLDSHSLILFLEYVMPKARTVVPGLKKRHIRAAINAARNLEKLVAPTATLPVAHSKTDPKKSTP